MNSWVGIWVSSPLNWRGIQKLTMCVIESQFHVCHRSRVNLVTFQRSQNKLSSPQGHNLPKTVSLDKGVRGFAVENWQVRWLLRNQPVSAYQHWSTQFWLFSSLGTLFTSFPVWNLPSQGFVLHNFTRVFLSATDRTKAWRSTLQHTEVRV